jgi:AMMECR1 domain-containing protein
VVVVIIGVLAAFGVPRFLDSVERSKASESFNYLSAVRAAQERHHARQGTYSEDLSELVVVVSVLTPQLKVTDPTDLVAGRDGVILEYEGRRGLFLPQVWDETGWTRVEFLRELASQKAGLPPDSWKQATLSTFRDQIFSE